MSNNNLSVKYLQICNKKNFILPFRQIFRIFTVIRHNKSGLQLSVFRITFNDNGRQYVTGCYIFAIKLFGINVITPLCFNFFFVLVPSSSHYRNTTPRSVRFQRRGSGGYGFRPRQSRVQ